MCWSWFALLVFVCISLCGYTRKVEFDNRVQGALDGVDDALKNFYRGTEGRLLHRKTISVSQCSTNVRNASSSIVVHWRSFARALHYQLRWSGSLSWRRLGGLALKFHLCKRTNSNKKICLFNVDSCPLGVIANHILMLLALPESYGFDARLIGNMAPAHRWEKLGFSFGLPFWNHLGLRISDVLYSGWPIFALLRKLRVHLIRVVDRKLDTLYPSVQEKALLFKHILEEFKYGPASFKRSPASLCALVWYLLGLEVAEHLKTPNCPLDAAANNLKQAERHLLKSGKNLASVRRIEAFDNAVDRAQQNLDEFLLWFQVPGDQLYHFAAKMLTMTLVSSDLILPQLQRLQERIDRLLTIKVPETRHVAAVNAHDTTSLNRVRLCPAARVAQQGVMIAEAAYVRDFHSSLGGFGIEQQHSISWSHSGHRLPPFNASNWKPQKPDNKTSREAWVAVLFGGTEFANQKSALINAEAIRTLAYSVRRAEALSPAAEKGRAFVVLVVGELPEAAMKDMQDDGLVVRKFESSEAPAMWESAFTRKSHWLTSNWFRDRGMGTVMAQLALFSFAEYDRVVHLDIDMLMLKPADELFSLGNLGFAAARETHRDQIDEQIRAMPQAGGARTYLYNTAVMAIKTDPNFLRHITDMMRRDDFRWAVERIGMGEPVFQDMIDIFWLFRSPRRGLTIMDSRGGFEGCIHVHGRSKHESFLFSSWALSPADHCLLPEDYNFFVDFPHISQAILNYRKALLQELPLDQAADLAGWKVPRAVVMNATIRWLRQTRHLQESPKIIHFPGVQRKPWMRWFPSTRSPWDELWWALHEEMCLHSARPCRIDCND